MSETTEARIEISRESLPHVIAKAFDLSKPQGLGFIHFKEGAIPEDVLQSILERSDNAPEPSWRKSVGLDYVEGRAVKLTIPYDEETGAFYISGNRWYDHSDEAWDQLKQYVQSLLAT